jgi:hypothetical protein
MKEIPQVIAGAERRGTALPWAVAWMVANDRFTPYPRSSAETAPAADTTG